jgi:peptidoglycan hydrolase-like protein with peptidoglycan-binding domain
MMLLLSSIAGAALAANVSESPVTLSAPLYEGSKGSGVRTVQMLLKALGYFTGNIDGTYSKATAAAVSKFQKNNGLTDNGVVDVKTFNKMSDPSAKAASSKPAAQAKPAATKKPAAPSSNNAARTLRYGTSGSDVAAIQQALQNLGYLGAYSGSVNGSFDVATRNAVKAFQAQNGLSADGVVGNGTRNKLYSGSAKYYTYTAAAAKPTPAPAVTYYHVYVTPTPVPYWAYNNSQPIEFGMVDPYPVYTTAPIEYGMVDPYPVYTTAPNPNASITIWYALGVYHRSQSCDQLMDDSIHIYRDTLANALEIGLSPCPYCAR